MIRLPASTTPKRSLKVSPDHLSESAVLETLPKPLKVRKAAKEASTAKDTVSQAPAPSSVKASTKSNVSVSAPRPTAASATGQFSILHFSSVADIAQLCFILPAADALVNGQVPKPSSRGFSKWINPLFEDVESWATNYRTLGSRKKVVKGM
jgi:hypothetical protein